MTSVVTVAAATGHEDDRNQDDSDRKRPEDSVVRHGTCIHGHEGAEKLIVIESTEGRIAEGGVIGGAG